MVGRIDVEQFMSEITVSDFYEQIAFDDAIFELQQEAQG